jgi:hypothetical protein
MAGGGDIPSPIALAHRPRRWTQASISGRSFYDLKVCIRFATSPRAPYNHPVSLTM